MPKRKYRRKRLSDREIQAGYDRWRAERWGPFVLQWMKANERDPSSIKTLELSAKRMTTDQRYQAIADCLAAAKMTLPDFVSDTGPRKFTKPQLLTAYCLKLLLEKTYRGLILHLEREFPERHAVFDDSFSLPSAITINRFVRKLDPNDWETFLKRLETSNGGLVLILQSRHENK